MQSVSLSLCFLALLAGAVHAQSKPDPAYSVAEIEIIDAANLKQFAEATVPILKAYGGEFVSRNGRVLTTFGTAPKAVVIIKFESLERAQSYFSSKEYNDIVPLRDAAMKYRGYIVEGGDHAR